MNTTNHALLQALLVFLLLCGVESQSVDVNVDSVGNYKITVDSDVWFNGVPTTVHSQGQWLSPNNGLQLEDITQRTGNWKGLGHYREISLTYTSNAQSDLEYVTSFFIFDKERTIVFGQKFPRGLLGCSVESGSDVIASFPTLSLPDDTDLTFLTFQDLWSSGIIAKASSTLPGYVGGYRGGVPLIFYDENLENTVVFSPLNNMPVGYITQPNRLNALAFGVTGMTESLPQGFQQLFILHSGKGVRHTVESWGRHLLSYYGKSPAELHSDLSTTYLGYWTDNGAYYYYNTEDGKSYEETLVDVEAYMQQEGIPVQYYQLDSWWYFKGINDGVKNWTAMPTVIPSGVTGLNKKLGKPFVLHNRYWSTDTDYAEKYPFYIESYESLPTEKDHGFWDYLMQVTVDYGCLVYEQDWLIDQFGRMNITQTRPHVARDWLRNMAKAAQKHNVHIQYCMPLWNDFLESAELQSVTQIRASDDYRPDFKQWNIGMPSLIAWSLGLLPFKDNFWSTSVQPGNKYKKSEPNPELQAAVSIFSASLVGISDKIGYTNKTLVMQTCAESGLLLKPDRPAISIENSFSLSKAPKGEIWDTHTDLGGYRWMYIIVAELQDSYSLYLSELPKMETNSSMLIYDWHDPVSSLTTFSDSHPLQLQAQGGNQWPFDLYVAVPVFANGFYLLGETGKFVTMSRMRFSEFAEEAQGFSVVVTASVGERVSVWLGCMGASDSTPTSVTCVGPSTLSCQLQGGKVTCSCA